MNNGLGGGGGHGGKGGDGLYKGSHVEGGQKYGSTYLPCELGSGSGDDSLGGSTAGGGIIGITISDVAFNNSLFIFTQIGVNRYQVFMKLREDDLESVYLELLLKLLYF